jgi:pyrroloquinoline quinone biosynthesis protein D
MIDNTAQYIRLSPKMRLQWEKAQEAYVLLYPEGMVQLNESAAVILQLCDGSRTAVEVVKELAQRFGGESLSDDVHEFLEAAHGVGWIVDV